MKRTTVEQFFAIVKTATGPLSETEAKHVLDAWHWASNHGNAVMVAAAINSNRRAAQ